MLAASIPFLKNPEEIARVVAQIESLTTQAFNLLDEAGRASVAEQFIEFLEGVRQDALDRTTQIGEDTIAGGETLAEKIAAVMDERIVLELAAAEKMEAAGETQMAAAGIMLEAAYAIPTTINSRVTVDVAGGETYDVGGL